MAWGLEAVCGCLKGSSRSVSGGLFGRARGSEVVWHHDEEPPAQRPGAGAEASVSGAGSAMLPPE